MNDDLNTPIVLSHLFDAVKIVNSANENKHSLSAVDIGELKILFNDYVINIFGLYSIDKENNTSDLDGLMQLVLEIRSKSKENKDWATADQIRDALNKLNIDIKDTKDGATWGYKK